MYIYIYIYIYTYGVRFDRFDFRTFRYVGLDIASMFPQAGPSMLSQVRVWCFGFDRFDAVSVSMYTRIIAAL